MTFTMCDNLKQIVNLAWHNIHQRLGFVTMALINWG